MTVNCINYNLNFKQSKILMVVFGKKLTQNKIEKIIKKKDD